MIKYKSQVNVIIPSKCYSIANKIKSFVLPPPLPRNYRHSPGTQMIKLKLWIQNIKPKGLIPIDQKLRIPHINLEIVDILE